VRVVGHAKPQEQLVASIEPACPVAPGLEFLPSSPEAVAVVKEKLTGQSPEALQEGESS
jgi:hypothetical protein